MCQVVIGISGTAQAAQAVTDPLAYVVNEFAPPGGSGFGGFVVPVDLKTGLTQSPISLGINPYGIALTPNGSTLWTTIRGQDQVADRPLDRHGRNPGAGRRQPRGHRHPDRGRRPAGVRGGQRERQ
jgi:sugar lactone lactonase YvrE